MFLGILIILRATSDPQQEFEIALNQLSQYINQSNDTKIINEYQQLVQQIDPDYSIPNTKSSTITTNTYAAEQMSTMVNQIQNLIESCMVNSAQSPAISNSKQNTFTINDYSPQPKNINTAHYIIQQKGQSNSTFPKSVQRVKTDKNTGPQQIIKYLGVASKNYISNLCTATKIFCNPPINPQTQFSTRVLSASAQVPSIEKPKNASFGTLIPVNSTPRLAIINAKKLDNTFSTLTKTITCTSTFMQPVKPIIIQASPIPKPIIMNSFIPKILKPPVKSVISPKIMYSKPSFVKITTLPLDNNSNALKTEIMELKNLMVHIGSAIKSQEQPKTSYVTVTNSEKVNYDCVINKQKSEIEKISTKLFNLYNVLRQKGIFSNNQRIFSKLNTSNRCYLPSGNGCLNNMGQCVECPSNNIRTIISPPKSIIISQTYTSFYTVATPSYVYLTQTVTMPPPKIVTVTSMPQKSKIRSTVTVHSTRHLPIKSVSFSSIIKNPVITKTTTLHTTTHLPDITTTIKSVSNSLSCITICPTTTEVSGAISTTEQSSISTDTDSIFEGISSLEPETTTIYDLPEKNDLSDTVQPTISIYQTGSSDPDFIETTIHIRNDNQTSSAPSETMNVPTSSADIPRKNNTPSKFLGNANLNDFGIPSFAFYDDQEKDESPDIGEPITECGKDAEPDGNMDYLYLSELFEENDV